MFYVDSQRTLTRRDSSFLISKRNNGNFDQEELLTSRGHSNALLTSNSAVSVVNRPRGSVQKELVTMLFESMLDSIVDSWEVIVQQKPEDSTPNVNITKTPSDTFSIKKKKVIAKPEKAKKSRSKIELDTPQEDLTQQPWWSGPDERAIIHFRNGNVYEGKISMKCMHGVGRFQWANGTVYLGQFKENEINGKGTIQWKDDCWYEGDFKGNLRHGKGLYVDSRKQSSYAGGWHCGTKHGNGVIYYSETFKNSYDGGWNHNIRHGVGSREYSALSGYKGEWNNYVREGQGLMIWPNHDYYKGEWKNGVMSGYGIYIWDTHYNNTMSLPSINAYRGFWEKGLRNGYGVLNLGLGLGSHYKGEFKKNMKNGVGKFVTNNGLILQHECLFMDDNLGPITTDDCTSLGASQDFKRSQLQQPIKFNICDDTVGLFYHIDLALKYIDKEDELRSSIINEYIENNKIFEAVISSLVRKPEYVKEPSVNTFEDLFRFEELSLRKSLSCYETELKNIYFMYATICNSEEIYFTPVLTRLYLWQLYYDCNVHEKGLTLVEIDKIFHQNPEWLARSPHYPFEKIYFWQFLHSLISVASRLYAKRQLPDTKPDTILANAFRTFMETDVLPAIGRRQGRLVEGFGSFVPLTGLYDLYRKLGEPHTIRTFLCAIRNPSHYLEKPQPDLVEAPDENLPVGRNVFVIGDEMLFVTDEPTSPKEDYDDGDDIRQFGLKLFNFGNLSSRTVIKIFSHIFPRVWDNGKIMDLNKELTFFEFFEAFIACSEESIRVKDVELEWRKKFM